MENIPNASTFPTLGLGSPLARPIPCSPSSGCAVGPSDAPGHGLSLSRWELHPELLGWLLSGFRQVMPSPSAWQSLPFPRKCCCLSSKQNTFSWKARNQRYPNNIGTSREANITQRQPSLPPSHMHTDIDPQPLHTGDFLLVILTIGIPVLLLEGIFHRALSAH